MLKSTKSNRAETTLLILAILGLLGLGALGLSKTKMFNGDSKRAASSAETTSTLVDTTNKQSAVAAASVVKIGEANSEAPDSPTKNFISREVPLVLAALPAPDIQALIQAEKRKVAVMEGRLQEASLLYGDAIKRVERLEREKSQALSAKRASDQELLQVAAERLGAEQQAFWAFIIAGAVGVLYLYTKLTHLSPHALASAVLDIRGGSIESNHAIQALDGVTTRLQQKMVSTISKLSN